MIQAYSALETSEASKTLSPLLFGQYLVSSSQLAAHPPYEIGSYEVKITW